MSDSYHINFEQGLTNYPRVIEPCCEVLEATAITADNEVYGVRLFRVDPVAARKLVCQFHPNATHFFGCSFEESDDYDIILAYSASGLIHSMAVKTDNGWETDTISNEITGATSITPSCRLLFKNQDAAATFIVAMAILAGKDDDAIAVGRPDVSVRAVAELLSAIPDVSRVIPLPVHTENDTS